MLREQIDQLAASLKQLHREGNITDPTTEEMLEKMIFELTHPSETIRQRLANQIENDRAEGLQSLKLELATAALRLND